MTIDLKRITQLIAELQAIDTAIVGLDSWRGACARLKVCGKSEHEIGKDVQISISRVEARDILGIQRAAKLIALKVHGLDVG